MKNLVTGASGFIGGHLTRALATSGEEVRVLARTTSDLGHLDGLDIEPFIGDLTHPERLSLASTGMDRVFHCAAVVADWGDPRYFEAVNVDGTRHLLTAAAAANVRKFVYLSSTEVYGYPDYPATERASYRYRGWPYCDTKIEAEKQVWEFIRLGLPATIVRPATVYGPRSGAILEFVNILQQDQMILVRGGRRNAGLIYVENLCDLMRIVEDPGVGLSTAYNAVDGLDVTWARFINTLADMLGKPPVRRSLPHWLAYGIGWIMERWNGSRGTGKRPLVTRMAVELIGTDQSFPSDRARRELGWQPKIGFEEGMRRVRGWLLEQGWLDGLDVAVVA
jgi:nucleoside-diphosphate-sugar epimerase